MSEFIRKPSSENIFEGTFDKEIEIFLKLKYDFGDRYDRNENNEYKFAKAIEIIQSRPHTCYFQKQKEFTNTYKVTGKAFTESNHKIIIPLENDKSFELIVSLRKDRINTFTELYSYRVVKFKEGTFTNEPKNPIKRSCIFKISEWDEKNGSDSERFKELYSMIESSTIPIVDINKDKDRQIWHNYVVAMKKLVKQKELVWKIQKISQPYSEKRDEDAERANYIDIYINEEELIDQLIEDIEGLFNPDELEHYGVSDEKAFIEFKNYRELSPEELNQLKELGEELFYELSASSPIHYVSGEIHFKYTDTASKDEIYSTIKEKLNTDYQLDANISKDGYIDLNDNDIPHLQKILTDNYSNLISLHRDNLLQLKVDFNSGKDLVLLKDKVKSILDAEGLTRSTVSISQDGKSIVIEVGAFIPPRKFSTDNLEFVESISRFSANRQIRIKPIEGLEIAGNCYQIRNANKEEIDQSLTALQINFPGVQFFRKRTLYYFKPSNRVNPEALRNFKTATDLKGKSEFFFANSTLNITADNAADYIQQIQRIQSAYPHALLQHKPFKPTYKIQFNTDLESRRQIIINKIQNEIRNAVTGKVEFDVIKNHSRVLFSYRFTSDEEREKLKQAVSDACTPNQDIVSFSIESNLGRTIYELYKNEALEIEKEKEVAGNVRQATFIYLTPEQKNQLSKAIELLGDKANFREGIQVGQLIKKEKDRLKFRITDEFDERINAREEDRIDLNEIKQGYIKPIFPGELTNIGRMIKAMKKVTEPGGKVGYPVNRNLSNFLFDPNEARQSATDIEEEKLKVIADLNEPLLKEQQKQLEAVAKTLVAKDLALIQGPPGTGKTTVIAEIIWQTLLREPQAKLLITSQTNLAVDNALERIKGKKLVRPIRIGNIDKFEDEGKVYSNDRIKKWLQAKTNSSEEQLNAENAVCQWIENVQAKCSTDEKYAKAVAKWKAGLHEKDHLIKTTFANAYYKNVNVFAATCSECGSRNFGDIYQSIFRKNSESQGDPEFDLVIMDEASKATPPELVLPLTLGKKVVIIGDHKQLPPMIDEQEFGEALEAVGAKNLIEHWTKEDYKVSQFEKLFKNAPKNFVASLDTQFRMHEQIMNCISQFYTDQEELENGLICGIRNEMNEPDFNVKASRWHGLKSVPFIDTKNHAVWVNVETPEGRVGTSYENEGEINAIQTVLRALTQADGFKEYLNYFHKDEDKEIGIITYYMPQMQRIRKAMYPTFSKNEWRNFEQNKYKNEFQIPFRINTVDRFQGMERNIIIISTVRSNKQYKEEKGRRIPVDNTKYPFALGFARELQRINVGFSRAKRLLIVVGNEKHFSHKPEYAAAIQKMHRVDLMQIQNLITQ
jgi:superfamily I DNA and/or RNA helicase